MPSGMFTRALATTGSFNGVFNRIFRTRIGWGKWSIGARTLNIEATPACASLGVLLSHPLRATFWLQNATHVPTTLT